MWTLEVQTAAIRFCDVIFSEQAHNGIFTVFDGHLLIIAEMIIHDSHIRPFVDAKPKSLHKIYRIIFDKCADRCQRNGTLFYEIDAENKNDQK